ncbi:MAG TPA: heme-binding protein [Bryobacteraceae bacterium]
MRVLFLLPLALCAQPSIQTEVRNGVVRAIVLHQSGDVVTDSSPAQPGEALTIQGSGFSNAPQLLVAGQPADSMPIDDGNLHFTLPADAGGGFLELAVVDGNAATLPVDAPADANQLASAEVQSLVTTAAMASDAPGLAIAVVDRAGNILAVYRRPGTTDDEVEKALAVARTGAFFSNEGTPLSSRTVRAISRVNFPEGVPNTMSGDLFGIENTNRGCSFNVSYLPGHSYPRYLSVNGAYSRGIGTVPGGIPLFRNGTIVIGGIGVSGIDNFDLGPNNYGSLVFGSGNEYVAAAAAQAAGLFVKLPLPDPGAVYIAGFSLPYVVTAPTRAAPAAGGVFQIGPLNGSPAAEGWLVGPLSSATLSVADVTQMVQNAIDSANRTRAAIRLLVGSWAKMVISVADLDGNILGIYRMHDSTIFSIDVALTKARNVVYFSGPNRDSRDLPGVPPLIAVTNRTIGFSSQTYFPSGISNTQPGPFADMYHADIDNPCTQGHQPANANQSGIVFFPGSAPLYRNGVLVGGLGVSGDGVDQDDFVTSRGAAGFEPPAAIRADQVFIRGVRLPYAKFPRNPEQ